MARFQAFTPTQAVVVAAVCELQGAATGTAVAATTGPGIVATELLSQGAVVRSLPSARHPAHANGPADPVCRGQPARLC
jgi:hypothetical protein